MSALPDGWKLVTLGDVIKRFETGRNFQAAGVPASGQETGVLKISSVTWGRFQPEENKALLPGHSSLPHERVQAGDLLISRANTTELVGAPVLVERDFPHLMLPDKILRIVYDPDAIDARYLLRALRSRIARAHIEKNATGTSESMRNLSQPKLREIPIPLAPLPEQKRIANKLGALLARVDACRERLDRVPAILKRFRQSVLAAATSGELTRNWRENRSWNVGQAHQEVSRRLQQRRAEVSLVKRFKEPAAPDLRYWAKVELPKSWAIESVSSFAECLDHLRIPVTKENRDTAEGKYPYFGANGKVDMVDNYIFDDELVLVTEDETFYGREKPIAYRSSGRCWVNNHAHVLRAGSGLLADYLCFSLMYYNVLPWLTGTTGRAKLTQAVLNAIPIAVPPEQEIEEIVRVVKLHFALADRLEAKSSTARRSVEAATPATLAKAFRGELVPQDPNDEPAAALLARIAAQRDHAAPAARGRGRTTGKRS